MNQEKKPYGALMTLLFLQMLPATLVVAAIRPLFALYHGGNVSAMHAFMSVNMLGAVVAAAPVAMLAERTRRSRRLFIALTFADAVLLMLCAMPGPVGWILLFRFLEGGAHVGAMTLLLAEASSRAKNAGEGRIMGIAGAAIVFAIAAGNACGGLLLSVSPLLPFVAGAWTAGCVASFATLRKDVVTDGPVVRRTRTARRVPLGRLVVPLSAAFLERFAVGCFVVSFALFARAKHGLPDTAVSWLYFAMTFTFALAMPAAGRLADRFPTRSLLSYGAIIYGFGLLSLVLVGPKLLVVSMIVSGVGAAMTFAAALSMAAKQSKARRASAMALLNAAGCLGMMIGPAVSGIVIAAARRSNPSAALSSALPIVIAAVALLGWSGWIRLRGRDLPRSVTPEAWQLPQEQQPLHFRTSTSRNSFPIPEASCSPAIPSRAGRARATAFLPTDTMPV